MKGLAISTVGAVILAIIALIILWLFISGGTTLIVQNMQNIMGQIVGTVCQHILGPLTGAAQFVGFCK